MRLSKYTRRWKKKITRMMSMLWLPIILISVTVFLLIWSPLLRIDSVTAKTEEAEVTLNFVRKIMSEKLFGLIPVDNYFIFSTEATEAEIKNKIGLTAIVSKKFPNTLLIEIKKNIPWVLYCNNEDEECWYVNENGIVFDEAPQFEKNPFPKIKIDGKDEVIKGDEIGNLETRQFISKISTFLEPLGLNAEKFTIYTEVEEITIKTNEGWDLLLSKTNSLERMFKDLELLINRKIKNERTKLEYIDMRFANKAFYK